jgi:hypothetical protein
MSLNGRACRDEASSLLPWYLNGTLEGAEETGVRSHLEACSIGSEELAQLAEAARNLAAQVSSARSPPSSLSRRPKGGFPNRSSL